MINNKGVSMVSLIVTIVLIIILASVSSLYLSSVMEDVQYKDAVEEMKNVENVVEYAKTQILINEFMPNQLWLIKDAELDSKFGKLLTSEEIEHIKQVNNSADIKAPYKYYLMNQTRFDSEFGNDYNVSDLRPAREYLVNYMDTTVVSTYADQRVATKEDIVPTDKTTTEDERAEISVAFTPNGNIEWKKQQATMVSIDYNAATTINSTKYLWSQSYTAPAETNFTQSISDGQTVNLTGKTGNDWYLWIYVSYKENGVDKTYITKSEPFYIDNTAPTANLEVEEINR